MIEQFIMRKLNFFSFVVSWYINLRWIPTEACYKFVPRSVGFYDKFWKKGRKKRKLGVEKVSPKSKTNISQFKRTDNTLYTTPAVDRKSTLIIFKKLCKLLVDS